MLRPLKINTALLICTAFIFKFLFINVGQMRSASSPDFSLLKSRSSMVIDTQTHVGPADASKADLYSAADFCEEDSNDDEQFKCHALLPVLVLYTLVTCEAEATVEKAVPCPQHFSYTSSFRYLLLRTFRI